MKHTKEETVNALKVISDECDAARDCRRCPFSDARGRCLIDETTPCGWEIADDKPMEWRALK